MSGVSAVIFVKSKHIQQLGTKWMPFADAAS